MPMPVDTPPDLWGWIYQQLQQYGRVGATQTYRIPALPAILAATGNPLATQVAPYLKWDKPGMVVAMYGQTSLATDLADANTELQLQFGSSEYFSTDGQGPSSMPFGAFFGKTQNWFPIMREVASADTWTATFTNNGAIALYPSVYFAFVAFNASCAR